MRQSYSSLEPPTEMGSSESPHMTGGSGVDSELVANSQPRPKRGRERSRARIGIFVNPYRYRDGRNKSNGPKRRSRNLVWPQRAGMVDTIWFSFESIERYRGIPTRTVARADPTQIASRNVGERHR